MRMAHEIASNEYACRHVGVLYVSLPPFPLVYLHNDFVSFITMEATLTVSEFNVMVC